MNCTVYLSTADCVPGTLSKREIKAGFVIINDPNRPENEREPTLKDSTIYRQVFANLTIGAITGLKGARDGCPSVIKYDDRTADKVGRSQLQLWHSYLLMLLQITSVCDQYQVSKRRRPSPKVFAHMIDDFGIPTKYGSDTTYLLATRVLGYIDRNITNEHPGLARMTTLGVKRIVDDAISRLTRKGTFDLDFAHTEHVKAIAETGYAPKTTPTKYGNKNGTVVRFEALATPPDTPPSTPTRSSILQQMADQQRFTAQFNVEQSSPPSEDRYNKNRDGVSTPQQIVIDNNKGLSKVKKNVDKVQRTVAEHGDRISDVEVSVEHNRKAGNEQYNTNHDLISKFAKNVKKVQETAANHDTRIHTVEADVKQNRGLCKDQSAQTSERVSEVEKRLTQALKELESIRASSPPGAKLYIQSLINDLRDELQAETTATAQTYLKLHDKNHARITDVQDSLADTTSLAQAANTVAEEAKSTAEASKFFSEEAKSTAEVAQSTADEAKAHALRLDHSLDPKIQEYTTPIHSSLKEFSHQVLSSKNPNSLAMELVESRQMLEALSSKILEMSSGQSLVSRIRGLEEGGRAGSGSGGRGCGSEGIGKGEE